MSCPHCNAETVVRMDDRLGMGVGACQQCLNPYLVRNDGRFVVSEPLPGVEPIDQWAPEGSQLRAILDICADNTTALPVMPATPARVLSLINDPLGDMNEIGDLITSDASLATRVLRLANSPIFGGRHEFRTVHAACVRLGMKQVGKVVSAAAARDVFRAPSPALQTMMDRQWSHALATAMCAEKLAHLVDRTMAPGLFMGGLVHDIGKAVVINLVASYDDPLVARLRDYPALLDKVLQRLHGVVGLHTAMRWDLPAEICIGAYYHRSLEQVPQEGWRQFARAISLASDLAAEMGYPSSDDPVPSTPADAAEPAPDLKVMQYEIQPILVIALDSLQSV